MPLAVVWAVHVEMLRVFKLVGKLVGKLVAARCCMARSGSIVPPSSAGCRRLSD